MIKCDKKAEPILLIIIKLIKWNMVNIAAQQIKFNVNPISEMNFLGGRILYKNHKKQKVWFLYAGLNKPTLFDVKYF